MQKLLERAVSMRDRKHFLLYSVAMLALSIIIAASAVVLNASALLANGDESTSNTNAEKVLSPFTVEILKNSDVTTLYTTGGTVESILSEVGIQLEDGAAVSPSLDTKITKSTTITVTDVFNIFVHADGKVNSLKMSKGSVKDALDAASIEIGANDIISKPLSESLKAEMTIEVSRVHYETVKKTETIPYKTIKTESSTVSRGKTVVTQAGKNGEKVSTYKVEYINGKAASETLVSSSVSKNPVPKKVTVGTKASTTTSTKKTSSGNSSSPSQISQLAVPSSVTFTSKGVPESYKKILTGTATAYGPKDGSSTSTGKKAMPGYVAVNPNVIPYGTKMYIVSSDGKYNYGYAIAADTGGAVKKNKIIADLYFSSDSDCYAFGRRQITIYVL